MSNVTTILLIIPIFYVPQMVLRMTDLLTVYLSFPLLVFFSVSTANLKSLIGKSTQYNLIGRVFLKTSKT